MPHLIIFDLDGTLAESKQPLAPEMALLLEKLISRTKVAVISGGALPQFLEQVVARLAHDAHLENLYLLPTSGGALYAYQDDEWKKIYEERLTQSEVRKIEEAMEYAARQTGLVDLSAPAFGPRIESRGSEVTFSALGQHAPIDLKKAWDPDKSKRRALQHALALRLPEFSVGMGGATSVDVTAKGIDKAYGIRKLCAYTRVPERDALYVGDELVAGGNDEAAFLTDVATKPVADPAETRNLITLLLAPTAPKRKLKVGTPKKRKTVKV